MARTDSKKTGRSSRSGPQKRRTAEEARLLILDAAERRLAASGTAGIRLQDVAADVGVSHPTVLHHFGSREALVRAVRERVLAAIHVDVVRAIEGAVPGEAQLAEVLEGVSRALEKDGRGRVVTWLALEGVELGEGAAMHLGRVVDASHIIQQMKNPGVCVTRLDAMHTVVLCALTLVAEAVIGPAVFRDAGLGEVEAAGPAFRGWVARLLMGQFDGATKPAVMEPP